MMKPTIKKLRRRGPSPIMPRKLTKKDIYPPVEKVIDQEENMPSTERSGEPDEGNANENTFL